jgi:long-chain fatty acid transport protein
MGTDWRGSTGLDNTLGKVDLYNMRSSLMLMQFAPSLAYGNDTFGIGLTAIVQYGALSIDYDTSDATHVGSGTSNDLGYGYQIGGYYNPMKSLTLGAVYKSAIDMEYKNQISDAAAAFGYGSNPAALAAKSDNLEQPAEYGIGVDYTINAISLTMDVKEIRWSDAKGYKDFGWDDQTVYAVGAKYAADSYWVGIGYNYGENPVPNNKSTVSVTGNPLYNTDGDTMNLFNYAMFPATVESAITLGGGYALSETLAFDVAYTYSPEVSDTVSAVTVAAGDVTTKHSQQAVTVAVKFNF